jgi:hypothetical protein
VTTREPLSRRPRTPRAFSLAAELRLLAVGLFAVAGAALLLHRSVPIGPGEVGLAVGVVVTVFVVNVAVGLAGVRRTARTEAVAESVEN